MSSPENPDPRTPFEQANDLVDPELIDLYLRAEVMELDSAAQITYSRDEIMQLMRASWSRGAGSALREPERIQELFDEFEQRDTEEEGE